jgi:hypothetical protein
MKFRVKPPTPQPARRPLITLQFKKDGGGPAPGRFVATMQSGHTGVFVRMPGTQMKKFATTDRKREKLMPIVGPSAAFMVGGPEAAKAIQDRANEILERRIEHHMNQVAFK